MTIYMHKGRGTLYEFVGIAKLQTDKWLDQLFPANGSGFAFDGPALVSVDMREVVVYRSVTNPDEIWVRPKEEFFDGRFEEVA